MLERHDEDSFWQNDNEDDDDYDNDDDLDAVDAPIKKSPTPIGLGG